MLDQPSWCWNGLWSLAAVSLCVLRCAFAANEACRFERSLQRGGAARSSMRRHVAIAKGSSPRPRLDVAMTTANAATNRWLAAAFMTAPNLALTGGGRDISAG